MNVVIVTCMAKSRWSNTSVGSFHWNTADKRGEEICSLTSLPVCYCSFYIPTQDNQQIHFIAPQQP